ncbi:rhodanese-like domain-containing protein [Cellulomonas endophytica]|uniref:rhodanese-like domain-containing protein n=1 Tax=Cellulomonas endophytica TaxID=2494735 RepID=UPI0010105365|nr:rhodanese-like domain-containing protein [Cellulomonas endophytica]
MDIAAVTTQGDLQLLDVREDEEWAAGHAPGALHIPLTQLGARMGELDPRQALAVVCRSGNRSSRAVAALTAAGLTAHNVEGGMSAWAAAGRPVTTDDGRPGRVL